MAADNVGSIFVGALVAAILYGCTCTQTWSYFTTYLSDPWYFKLLVTVVFFLDTGHQALITHIVYTYGITYYGVYSELDNVLWSVIAEVFLNAFTTFFVQCFLTMRVYKLSNRSWLATGTVMIIVIAQFFVAIVFCIKGLGFEHYSQFGTLKGLSMAVNGLATTGDLLIALILCFMLHRSRTGFEKSDRVIGKLIMFSVNTGLVTSLCAIASLISIILWPHAWTYIAFYYCTGRLYCNTLLATLNARRVLRGGFLEDDPSVSFHGHSLQQRTNHTFPGTTSRVITHPHMPNNISVKIDTTEEYVRDEQHSFSSSGAKTHGDVF